MRPTIAVSIALLAAGALRPATGGPSLAAQEVASASLSDRLDEAIPRLMDAGGVPGLSAALVLDGSLAWSGAFGTADAATGAPVTDRTVFQAASLTKQVFAYTVLRLADRGVIDLHTPLAEHLPYPRLEGEEGYPSITARHALSHSTGLPNWGGDHLELGFAPGDGFQYSGEGYVYLQRTLEHLTGLPLATLIEREVLIPLGLERSWIFWRPEFEDDAAAGHDDWGQSRGIPRGDEANAAASFLTTAEDYARILIAIMDAEGFESGTLREALSPQIQVASRPQLETSDRLYWGLGWGLQLGGAGRAMWQWGHNGGFRAYLLAFPDRRDAFVYFSNSDAGLSIGRALVEAVGDAAGWEEDEHWALTWLDYEPHDSPARVARRSLVDAFLRDGAAGGFARFESLRTGQPEIVDDPFTAGVGRALAGMGRADDAVALLRRNAELNPRNANSLSVLGDVQLETGRYGDALETYESVLDIRPAHQTARRTKEWIAEAVAALDDPREVVDGERFAGTYGPRHVEWRDGVLYYRREGNPRYRLHPLGGDTFLLDELGTFRVRFVSGDDGVVSKIVGLYVDGNEDETPRTP